MHKPSLTLTILILSTITSLTNATCITSRQAHTIGHTWAQLVSNYTDTLALNALASTFTDQADSVTTLIDSASQPQTPLKLGSLTFPSKEAYMQLSSQQPSVPFQVLNTWHTCGEVSVCF